MPSALASAVAVALQVAAAGADSTTPRTPPGAFADSAAQALVQRARAARLRQDSGVVSYDAMGHQRLSVGLRAGPAPRARVLLRSEHAARVRWHRRLGAHVEVVGARRVHPGASRDGASRGVIDGVADMVMLPYYPGQEALWVENGLEVMKGRLVHPLADGAEAHYTYESGGAVTLRLPDETEVRVRELKVRPRGSRWDLVVGSLWLDADRGQLVRAAYRLAEPIDVWARVAEDHAGGADPGDDVPRVVRALARPLRAYVTAIVVEYGLHGGRFWLPRLQSLEGHAEVGFARATFSMEQRYRYAAVNAPALESLPPVPEPRAPARADAGSRRPRVSPCDTGAAFASVATRTHARIRVSRTVPCDHRALAASPELPGSIYDEGEELFDREARDALVREALGLRAQPGPASRPPAIEIGPHLARFNRIEGLSLGVHAAQPLGAGLAADATFRLGLADREPAVEFGLGRSNLDRTVRVGAYRRLASANDWGDPLSLGGSLSALLWGRDDGFYFRAGGLELTGTRELGTRVTWRLFAERQWTAVPANAFSLAGLVRNVEFGPNVTAGRGAWAGASLRGTRTLGLDPRDWRLLADVRLEAAAGATQYGRAAADVTFSRAMGAATGGAPLAALTLGGGTGVGRVPPQRRWHLGGAHTVRGQPAGAASGDVYWLGRLELAHDLRGAARLSAFGDAARAGLRAARDVAPATISGAGVGLGVLDGLLRLDVAKGLRPRRGWRPALYLEARF